MTPGEKVVLGFDGAWTNASTALVGCTLADLHLFCVRLWERSLDAASWVVPSGEVEAALLEAVGMYDVLEVACDPHFWREQVARWDDLGLPVVEWPTNVVTRIVPACREFHIAVVEGRLTHDGDPRLARHVADATVKTDQAGSRIVQSSRGQRIDLAVAAVIAFDRAHARREAPPKVEFILL